MLSSQEHNEMGVVYYNKFNIVSFTHTSIVPFINQWHVGGSFSWFIWNVKLPPNWCLLSGADFTLGRECCWSGSCLSFHKPNWLCLFSIFQFLPKACCFPLISLCTWHGMHLAGRIPQALGISILLYQLIGFPIMHLFTSIGALEEGVSTYVQSFVLLSFFSNFNLFPLNEGLASSMYHCETTQILLN